MDELTKPCVMMTHEYHKGSPVVPVRELLLKFGNERDDLYWFIWYAIGELEDQKPETFVIRNFPLAIRPQDIGLEAAMPPKLRDVIAYNTLPLYLSSLVKHLYLKVAVFDEATVCIPSLRLMSQAMQEGYLVRSDSSDVYRENVVNRFVRTDDNDSALMFMYAVVDGQEVEIWNTHLIPVWKNLQ